MLQAFEYYDLDSRSVRVWVHLNAEKLRQADETPVSAD